MAGRDFDENRDLPPDLDRRSDRVEDRDHEIDPETGDVIGEATGGISGVLTGAALGSLGGPIGTIIGGIAGAVGGWWAGHAISEAARHATHGEQDTLYREHYETSSNRLADRTYDDVRPAYQLGHLASRNPDYRGRNFDEVESDLQRGWTGDVSTRHGDWSTVRGYARDAYDRGRMNVDNTSGTVAGDVAYGAGRVADRVDDAADRARYGTGADDEAHRAADRVDAAADRTGNAAENAWDKTKAGAERLGDKVERGFDNVKDRVDGNPASKPGPDPTDRRF